MKSAFGTRSSIVWDVGAQLAAPETAFRSPRRVQRAAPLHRFRGTSGSRHGAEVSSLGLYNANVSFRAAVESDSGQPGESVSNPISFRPGCRRRSMLTDVPSSL